MITPEHINAVGIAVAAVIGSITAWQAKQVKQLRDRVDVLEQQSEAERKLFKLSVRLIRDLLSHITALTLLLRHHAPQEDLPDPPQVPAELQEEI